ncbi:MAG TPA: methyltransferase [Candidatus Nitrosocosmicus sp.]
MYEYIQQNQNDADVFYDAMTAMTSSQVTSISSINDFLQFNTIADIGRGQGVLLSTILKNNPRLHGILFDLPHAIESAKENVIDKDTNIVSSSLQGDCRRFLQSHPIRSRCTYHKKCNFKLG